MSVYKLPDHVVALALEEFHFQGPRGHSPNLPFLADALGDLGMIYCENHFRDPNVSGHVGSCDVIKALVGKPIDIYLANNGKILLQEFSRWEVKNS